MAKKKTAAKNQPADPDTATREVRETPEPKEKPIWVKARQNGHYGDKYRNKGEIFQVKEEKHLSKIWMYKLTPEQVKVHEARLEELRKQEELEKAGMETDIMDQEFDEEEGEQSTDG